MNLVMQKYRVLGKKGEGTFSEVLKCQHIKDNTYFACKKMKQHYDSIEQVNNLREIQALRRLNPHPNIINLEEVVFDKKTGVLVLVCELMDMNIYELIRGKRHYLPARKVQSYMYQLAKSIEHLHRTGIFHRDVKPENILIKDDVLKLADFGSCRSVYSKQPYTEYISTRWYRAPECLLTDGFYSYKMDIWSMGCVFFEIVSLHPLFPGSNEVDQIAKIHDIMGTPDASVLNKLRNKTRGMNFNFPQKRGTGIEKLLGHASSDCIDLIYQMCAYDPEERITARQALRHPYFKELRDADKKAAKALRMTEKDKTDGNRIEIEEKKDNPSQDQTDSQNILKSDHHHIQAHPKAITLQPHPHPHRERRKHKRHHHHKRLSENNHQTTMLPKVHSQADTGALKPSYPSTTFTTESFPKIHHTKTTMLPSITNTYKTKTKVYRTSAMQSYSLPGTSQASKNIYGHYQLPSIDRRGAGY